MNTKDEILSSIEKVMLALGATKPYHAKISAEAILNVLAEEGWLDEGKLSVILQGDAEESGNSTSGG